MANGFRIGSSETEYTSSGSEFAQNGLSRIARPEDILRIVIRNVREPVILIDRDFRVLEINAAALESIGLPPDTKDLVLDSSVDPGPVTDVTGRRLTWEDSVHVRAMRGETVTGELMVHSRGGKRRYLVSAYPLRSDSGDVEAVLVVGNDITALRDLESRAQSMLRALAQQERAQRTVIESMPAALLVVDPDLRVRMWNQAFACHFGPHSEWREGHRLQDVAPNAESSGLVGALRQALETRSASSIREFRHEGSGMETTYWNVSIVPIEGDSETGSFTDALAVVCVDVTEERHVRERLRAVYVREHVIAEKLQTSFMLQGCPRLRGFDLGHCYEPGLDEAMVGGDFYDVFRLGEDRLGIVIADVAGKGLKAAVYTGMIKHMLKAYALEDSSPDNVLCRLNEALNSCTPPEVFATLVYGVLDGPSAKLTYGNAGHEPPIYRSHADGLAVPLDVTGRALALAQGSTYATRELQMSPGDLLLLYTDGITDAGSGARRLGSDELLRLVSQLPDCSAQEVADRVLAAGRAFAGGHLTDDAAVLSIKALGENGG